MRKAIVAALAVGAALAAGLAAAQETPPAAAPEATSRCGDFTEPPQIPDGATATRPQVMAASEAHGRWSGEAAAILNCRIGEVNELSARVRALTAQFNERKTRFEAANANAEAEVAEFNAR